MRDSSLVPSVLIDAAELARMQSISKLTVWRWLAESRLSEPIRLTAQCLRWKCDDVLEWVDRGCPAQNKRPTAAGGEASVDLRFRAGSEVRA